MASRKAVAIVQSNYIPWKGYFDLIHSVDEFVLFDDMQYTRRDWRNRNKIKTPAGTTWLTIPVSSKGKYLQTISATAVSDPGWAAAHWKTISNFYARAPYFTHYSALFEELYLGCKQSSLSEINHRFLVAICSILGIPTRISRSSDYHLVEGKTERLVAICQQAGAGRYISGPAGRPYIDPRLFAEADIELVFFDYAGYPEYRQLYPPFRHDVSVIDLILNAGQDAPLYMKSFSCICRS